ncbi:MAG: preprotein translocase subunit SecE, partial [Phycisphaerae bacterium]|nr:preprotein translocase subunit SecE [Phycisphaerae bacterium]
AVQGGWWIWDRWGQSTRNINGKYIAGGAALLFLAAMGMVMWWYLARNHRSVDFLIATEGEMKKVNWSTRREIIGSTGAVIFTMIVIALFCFLCDQVFALAFTQIGVLDGPAASGGA